MRLLNTSTHTLSDFQSNIPHYAILSHMWQREEVTFQDVANLDKARLMKGWEKIVGACNTAKGDHLEYIWIDTCCINKESSAELSEAINSMYAWYRNAHICYAYLWDVPSGGDHEDPHSPFSLSLWFTRGWTLQELIAPPRVIFFANDWVDIGTKATLQHAISTTTGIETGVITGYIGLDRVPVAVRMSWAAKRSTTREEDAAYSLMGIFDVNMPLLYGEGGKAFIRLQHEIIKMSDDHSIFAWTVGSRTSGLTELPLRQIRDTCRGMLATSPQEFLHSHNVERIPHISPGPVQENGPSAKIPAPYSLTNKGLHMELPTVVIQEGGSESAILASLNCRFFGERDPIRIILVWSKTRQRYLRSKTIPLLRADSKLKKPGQLSSLYIADDCRSSRQAVRRTNLKITTSIPPSYGKLKIWNSSSIMAYLEKIDGQLRFSKSEFFASHHEATELLVFDDPGRHEHFGVFFSVYKPGVLWCDILTGLEPVDNSQGELFLAYEAAVKTRSRVNHFALADRAFAELTDGWLIAASMSFDSQSEACGRVEIKRGTKYQLPILKQPSGVEACLIIPLINRRGFVVDVNKLQGSSPNATWIEHNESFIWQKKRWFPETVVDILPFKSTISEERFYLLLKHQPGEGIESSIEEDGLGILRPEYRSIAETAAYQVDIGDGKTVFVTQRKCPDHHFADWVIYISM